MIDFTKIFDQKDFSQIQNKGIDLDTLKHQFEQFIEGVKPISIVEQATISNSGIKVLTESNLQHYTQLYQKKQTKFSITKFVPASGAATRMFKELFEFVNSDSEIMIKPIENLIFNIKKFAFYEDLNTILEKENSSIDIELDNKNYKKIITLILSEKGLNYGNLPKGLLKFHRYENHNRTAFEEHLAESIQYATSENGNNIHFTVSPEHQIKFKELADEIIKTYELKFNTKINISFSEQDSATDTIALTPENKPFRNSDNSLLFRPAGHGALIYNLNKIESDIIFIKNIDNVIPDKLKATEIQFKKALAGILLEYQTKTFELIDLLLHQPSVETVQEAFDFLQNTLCVKMYFRFKDLSFNQKIDFLVNKLDRPIRICGMVKNEGEPGGGPFFVKHLDNTATLQIVEKAQIDLTNKTTKEIFESSTHFNPVDLVLSPMRYNGEKFDLSKYVDPSTGFISEKSKDGKLLKALELPGLWNGAMADWNTIFVETPVETFNPVKNIFDMLRAAHQ